MLERGDASEWGFFTWPSAAVLPASEVDAARKDLDPLTFQQEYEASFVNFVGQAYYSFGPQNKAKLEYNPDGDIALCFDFNVAPGVAVIVQEQTLWTGVTGTAVVGEVYIPQNSNTEAVCRKLVADWGDHRGRLFLYGDATGGAKGSAKLAGSDWDIVEREIVGHFGSRRVYSRVPKSNPSERARLNAMNTRICNAEGVRRLVVDPARAPYLVKDLEGVRLLEGGSGEIDKKADPKLTHSSDALGYYVVREHPTNKKTAKVDSFRVV
jgi:hypothetical protein